MFKDYKGDGTDTLASHGAYNGQNVNLYNTTIAGFENWGTVPYGGIRAYKSAAYERVNGVWVLRTGINLNAKDADNVYIYRFPELEYYETYKPLYSHLEVISGSSYTSDATVGAYITYVSNDNVLHWEPRKTTVDGDALESETISTSVTREVRDVVNATIVNVGNDVKGRGILALTYDMSSMMKYGAKWKYTTNSNLSEQIMTDQKIRSGVPYNDDNNFPTTYPVYVKVPGESAIKDSDTELPIWKYNYDEEINGDADFNLYIRRVSREAGKKFGQDAIIGGAEPKFFLKMDLEYGTQNFGIGDYITVEVPSVSWEGLDAIELRVQEVRHTINNNGWATSLTLEQDIIKKVS